MFEETLKLVIDAETIKASHERRPSLSTDPRKGCRRGDLSCISGVGWNLEKGGPFNSSLRVCQLQTLQLQHVVFSGLAAEKRKQEKQGGGAQKKKAAPSPSQASVGNTSEPSKAWAELDEWPSEEGDLDGDWSGGWDEEYPVEDWAEEAW